MFFEIWIVIIKHKKISLEGPKQTKILARFLINGNNSKLLDNIIITNALHNRDLQIQTTLASKTRASVLFENWKQKMKNRL